MRSTADGDTEFEGSPSPHRSLAFLGKVGVTSRPAEAVGAPGHGASAVGRARVRTLRIDEPEIGRIVLRDGSNIR